MARDDDELRERIIALLDGEANGLGVSQIVERLQGANGRLSPRAVRDVLNEMAESGRLVRVRRSSSVRGAPPLLYYHPRHTAIQLALELVPGLEDFKIQSRPQIEEQDLDPEERDRQARSHSVMHRLAEVHVEGDRIAQDIVDIAPHLAEEDPVELIVAMARWVRNDINGLGDEMHRLRAAGEMREAETRARELEVRLHWAKRILQRFFRLHRGAEGLPGIFEFPDRARRWTRGTREATLDEERARTLLRARVVGTRVLEVIELGDVGHTQVAGTDASVADVYIEHPQGSFVPPDPVSVMTAAAALQVRQHGGDRLEYQEFDIFPDRLSEYGDTDAAVEGLVLSPSFRNVLPEEDFKHSRMAAMDLRQYYEDLRIGTQTAKWRPMGEAPTLGQKLAPTMVIRDGRLLPLVHRLRDYDHGGLYGEIVRGEMARYARALLNIVDGPNRTVYAATVKSPELSWLSPLVMWYLLTRGATARDGQLSAEDVYKAHLTDTAVAHLLFLGLAKTLDGCIEGRAFRTFLMIRRFSDIAVCDDGALPVVESDGEPRAIDENDEEEWEAFIREHIEDRERAYRAGREGADALDLSEYATFINLCCHAAVAMGYMAPSTAYRVLLEDDQGAHFLLPRFEFAVDTDALDGASKSGSRSRKRLEKDVHGLLAWLASDGTELDRRHTQESMDPGHEGGLPILVPDVIMAAHETVTFARNILGDEFVDALKELVAELRRRK